jgi:hypothetical protein
MVCSLELLLFPKKQWWLVGSHRKLAGPFADLKTSAQSKMIFEEPLHARPWPVQETRNLPSICSAELDEPIEEHLLAR